MERSETVAELRDIGRSITALRDTCGHLGLQARIVAGQVWYGARGGAESPESAATEYRAMNGLFAQAGVAMRRAGVTITGLDNERLPDDQLFVAAVLAENNAFVTWPTAEVPEIVELAGVIGKANATIQATINRLLAQPTKNRTANGDAPSKLSQALAMLAEHNGALSDTEIAKRVGIHRSTLGKQSYAKYRAARKAIKASSAANIARGTKGKDGTIEAIYDDE